MIVGCIGFVLRHFVGVSFELGEEANLGVRDGNDTGARWNLNSGCQLIPLTKPLKMTSQLSDVTLKGFSAGS